MLGQPLFQRTARGMVPSDAGLRWIERFELVLAELRHIPDDVAALDGVVQGIVTVGALPLARTQLLPQAIASLLLKFPKLQVRSLESTFAELTAGLLSGRVDFIVGALRDTPGDAFSTYPLVADEAAVIARAGHPLAQRKTLTLDELMQYPWVLSRAGTPLRDSIDRFFERQGIAAHIAAVETGDLALLRGVLVWSDMLTILSAHQLHVEISTGQLVVLPFRMPGLERKIGVTTRNHAHFSPGAKALLHELEEISKAWR
jgi:LysR family transcriptional regulator of gallate degradation